MPGPAATEPAVLMLRSSLRTALLALPLLALPLLALPLLLAACGGSRPPAAPAPAPPPEPEAPATPPYETFDASRYDAEPPPIEPEPLAHDVPELLMEGRLVVDDARRVQGFRIQVGSAAVKTEADAVRDSVRVWWQQAQGLPDVPAALAADPSVDVDFQRPYYRVRLGAFLDQEDALGAVRFVRGAFPEAFVVPAEIVAPARRE